MSAWLRGAVAIGVLVVAPFACELEHERVEPEDDDSGLLCAPGRAVACECPGGERGVTTCLPDGSGWRPCEGCPPVGGTGGTGGSGGTAGPGPCHCMGNLGLGETAECQECIGQRCCTECQTCATGVDCSALLACGSPGGACEVECFYLVCTTPFGYPFEKHCVDCLSTNCCSEYEACWADMDCQTCLLVELHDPVSCQATTLDEDVVSCKAAACGCPCEWVGCGGGGTGGQAGQGGAAAGGTGGAGGQGG